MSAPEFTIRYLDPETLTPSPSNFRRHPDSQREALGASIEEHGWLSAPIWNEQSGHLLDGHARVELAIEQGEATIPVRVVDVSEEQEKRILRAFDQIGAMAEIDTETLDRLIEEIDDASLERLLGELGEPESGLVEGADPDAVPETSETRCKPDDLWTLGEHRLLCGDNLLPENVEHLLGDTKPVLMVTDPPYGISLDMEWRDRAGKNRLGPAEPSFMKRRDHYKNADISYDDRSDWSESFALVPSLQVAYVWCADRHMFEVLQGLLSIGFEHWQLMIWNKGMAVMSRLHYWVQHEPFWYVRKKNAPWFGAGGTANATVWDAPSPKFIFGGSDEEKVDHPTQKPVRLWQRPMENHTVVGEAVYEPFGGSGTAIMAAESLQRRCFCMEIEPRYCDVILARWEAATGQKAKLQARSA